MTVESFAERLYLYVSQHLVCEGTCKVWTENDVLQVNSVTFNSEILNA